MIDLICKSFQMGWYAEVFKNLYYAFILNESLYKSSPQAQSFEFLSKQGSMGQRMGLEVYLPKATVDGSLTCFYKLEIWSF